MELSRPNVPGDHFHGNSVVKEQRYRLVRGQLDSLRLIGQNSNDHRSYPNFHSNARN